MHVFMAYVRDENFCQSLPKELNGSRSDDARIKVMAFPPLGIQTLAPVLRQHGHRVRLFDTCHPQMQAEHIAQAAEAGAPRCHRALLPLDDHLPGGQRPGPAAEAAAPDLPIILGGAFATMNSDRILETALTWTAWGSGRAKSCCRII